MIRKISVAFVLLLVTSLLFIHSSCKSCKKEDKTPTNDTTAMSMAPPVNSVTLPHADTAIIPILAKVLDQAFEASRAKDYNTLASLVVYRGPDSIRYGQTVFNAKNSYDKKSLSITADVFNKWNRNLESRDYGRVFSLDQPDGRTLPVLEVIFVSKKTIDRKFFGFLEINGEYKIADVTSRLQ